MACSRWHGLTVDFQGLGARVAKRVVDVLLQQLAYMGPPNVFQNYLEQRATAIFKPQS